MAEPKPKMLSRRDFLKVVGTGSAAAILAGCRVAASVAPTSTPGEYPGFVPTGAATGTASPTATRTATETIDYEKTIAVQKTIIAKKQAGYPGPEAGKSTGISTKAPAVDVNKGYPAPVVKGAYPAPDNGPKESFLPGVRNDTDPSLKADGSRTPSATATGTATVTATQTAAENRSTFKYTWKEADLETPAEVGIFKGAIWSIDGLPKSVDPKTVLVAKDKFKNTIGLGTESWLAEKGTVLVGPEFPQQEIIAANGAIERINPMTQQMITANEQSTPVAENRFGFATFGSAKVEVNGVMLDLQYQKGHVWGLIVRGLFADGQQDTDRNHTLLWHEVPRGHVNAMNYPQNGGGFISEEHFKQVRENAWSDGTNCGNEGCSKMDVVFVDLNTGAFTIVRQGNPNSNWEFVASNWKQPNIIATITATLTKMFTRTPTPTPSPTR